MQSKLAVAVVFVVGCVAGGAASQMVVSKARANPSAPRWAYNCIEADRTESFDLPVDALNKNGEQGWELVSMLPTKPNLGEYEKFIYCFKRPAP
jgi:hypothetical protein